MLPLNAAYILGHVAFLTGGSKASESHGLACHDASLRTSVRAVHFEGVCSASRGVWCKRAHTRKDLSAPPSGESSAKNLYLPVTICRSRRMDSTVGPCGCKSGGCSNDMI